MADDDRTDNPMATDLASVGVSAARDTRRYDLQDLRLRISLGCTAGEVGELASRFGVAFAGNVGAGSGAAGADAAARALLRELDRQGRVGALVDYLCESKPLVEWPSPLPEAPTAASDAWGEGPAAEPAQGGRLDTPAPPLPVQGDGPRGAVAAVSTSTGAPDAPGAPPARLPPTGASEPLAAPAPHAPRPILLDPLSDSPDASAPGSAVGGWLGQPRTRIVVGAAVAVLIVVVALSLGFWVGRTGPAGPSAASTDGSSPAAAGPTSLAASASEELTLAVAAVAKACGVSNAAGPARDVLAQAFRRCDRSSLPSLPPRTPQAGAGSEPTSEPEPASRPPAGGPQPRTPAPAPARGGCMQRCQDEHRQCKQNECGEEPTQGSQYEEYQRCLGRCLTRASQCKMRCG